MKNIILKASDNQEIKCYLFEPEKPPKASVLLVHGMQEHAGRYKDFCNFLVKNGFSVLAPDLRGHGKTAGKKEWLGYCDGDIYLKTLEDLEMMLGWLKKSYSVPVYVFAHSYGSMLAQTLMQKSDIAEKYVLCGTGNGESFLYKFANKVTKMLAKNDPNKKAELVEKLSFNAYAKKFENGNWLTRDEKIFEEYKNDEFCGGSFPYSFYTSLFSNLRQANKGIEKISDKTKIFLIAGTKDCVNDGGKQVKALLKEYKKKNKLAEMKLYKDCRHELLNELNKEEVYSDILNFFNS